MVAMSSIQKMIFNGPSIIALPIVAVTPLPPFFFSHAAPSHPLRRYANAPSVWLSVYSRDIDCAGKLINGTSHDVSGVIMQMLVVEPWQPAPGERRMGVSFAAATNSPEDENHLVLISGLGKNLVSFYPAVPLKIASLPPANILEGEYLIQTMLDVFGFKGLNKVFFKT